jgi:hypothetical protein
MTEEGWSTMDRIDSLLSPVACPLSGKADSAKVRPRSATVATGNGMGPEGVEDIPGPFLVVRAPQEVRDLRSS